MTNEGGNTLVPDWLYVADVAADLGVSLPTARDRIRKMPGAERQWGGTRWRVPRELYETLIGRSVKTWAKKRRSRNSNGKLAD